MTVRHGWLLVLGVLGVTALGLGWWFVAQPMELPAFEVAPQTRPAAIAHEAALAARAAPSPAAGAASSSPDNMQRAEVGATLGVQVRGRCVDGDGEPLAGAIVHLQGVRGGRVSGTTTADGAFTLHGEPEDKVPVHLHACTDKHVESIVPCGLPRAGQVLDVGVVTLTLGTLVTGRVVDTSGQPVDKLTLHTMPAGEGWSIGPRCAAGVTGADGTFTLSDVLAPGRWLLRADPREFTMPAVFTLTAGMERHEMLLTLAERRAPATIKGKVVKVDGTPAGGIDVLAAGTSLVTTSAPNGSFRLVGWERSGDARLVLIEADSPTPSAPISVCWGTQDARLIWRGGTDVEIVVRRNDSGAAVPNASVGLSSADEGSLLHLHGLTGTTDADGRVRFAQVLPGSYLASAQHADLALVAHANVQVTRDGPARGAIEMAPTITRTVTVTSGDGRPVAQAQVGLWSPEAHPPRTVAKRAARHMITAFNVGAFDSRHGTRWGGGITDGRGRCVVKGPAHSPGRLRVAHRDHATLVREVSLAAVAEPWVEVLSGGAVVEGHFDQRHGAFGSMLFLERLGGTPEIFPDDPGMAMPRGAGSFRLAGVPAGSWRLFAAGQGKVYLADVLDLRAGETRRVDIESGGHVSAEVHGTVRWNGRPFGGSLILVGVDPESTARIMVAVDAHSGFTAKVPAGRYRPAIGHWLGGSGLLPFPTDVHAAAGSRTPCELNLRTRAVRVRLLRGGEPDVGTIVIAAADPRFEATFAPTDDYGCAEFALSLGTHPMFARGRRDPAARVALGSVDVSSGEFPQVVVIEVPAEVGR
jgi:protocatechuate 3,4-dioxygenase beta subunit